CNRPGSRGRRSVAVGQAERSGPEAGPGRRMMAPGDSRFFEESVNAGKLKALLDGRSHNAATGIHDRTQAIKWLLAMVCKGRDVSQFYPDVVKNVIVKSVELKKLVYVFLIHYADHDASCRDAALLSINSFQKDLADRNQLIRALALRTMTSIRVRSIFQLQLMAVKKCATDPSAYVRKTVAHALPKLHSLDRSQAAELEAMVNKLLCDTSTMVVGSAVAAFSEVCPERYDLIHPIFRRLCGCLRDVDEWGQIALLSVLARYARTFFCRPHVDDSPSEVSHNLKVTSTGTLFAQEASPASAQHSFSHSGDAAQLLSTRVRQLPSAKELQSFYGEDGDASDDAADSDLEERRSGQGGADADADAAADADAEKSTQGAPPLVEAPLPDPEVTAGRKVVQDGSKDGEARPMEPDHKNLLKAALPLLHSRNSGVVLSVCSLLWNCGRRSNTAMERVASALVCLLRSHREVQFMALQAIVPIASQRAHYFRPYLRELFVNASSDAAFVRFLKVDVLTLLVCRDNVDQMLAEFEVYLSHPDKGFVCAVIRAVGRVVNELPELADRCLRGLVTLMTSENDKVVAEAVVVTRAILQQHPENAAMVRQLVSMLDHSRVPAARASLIWIATEFAHFIPELVPEMLRKLALSFSDEHCTVKIQILSLAVRASFMFAPEDPGNFGVTSALGAAQTERVRGSVDKLRDYIVHLGEFDADFDLRDRVRFVKALSTEDRFSNVHSRILLQPKPAPKMQGIESRVIVDSRSNFTFDSLSHCVGHKVTGYRPLAEWPTREPNPGLRDPSNLQAVESTQPSTSLRPGKAASGRGDINDFYADAEDDDTRSMATSATEDKAGGGQDDLLAMFDEFKGTTKEPSSRQLAAEALRSAQEPGPEFGMLLSKVHGEGMQVEHAFSRQRSSHAKSMNVVNLRITNTRATALRGVKIGKLGLVEDQQLVPFPEIDNLAPAETRDVVVNVDFGGKVVPCEFSFANDRGQFPVALSAPVGELVVPAPELLDSATFDT
ncbi:AP-3 complex subunit beta-1 (Adaptor protein complex AP-3 subunit beta-1) (Adaptor-related protein complex 3 subunit beta-1) (Beta-3A-adaptin) (Clathrin assembly protein complex 3 beta-1 large chain), partial [Durusdinium trenchii]